VTSANSKASAARFLDENNLIVGILRPAAEAAPAASEPAPGATTRPAPPSVPPAH